MFEVKRKCLRKARIFGKVEHIRVRCMEVYFQFAENSHHSILGELYNKLLTGRVVEITNMSTVIFRII